jgi:translation initiation factor IF-2
VKEALVSEPVRVVGLKTLPAAGDELIVVESEARAQLVADLRQRTAQLRYVQHFVATASLQ